MRVKIGIGVAPVVAVGEEGPRDEARVLRPRPLGPGAAYAWAGNSEVGEGRMTITDSRPGQSVTVRLEFLKPFAEQRNFLANAPALEELSIRLYVDVYKRAR